MRILGDVAPYSREYQKYAGSVRHSSKYDSDIRAEYERIQEQVRQTKESTLQVTGRQRQDLLMAENRLFSDV